MAESVGQKRVNAEEEYQNSSHTTALTDDFQAEVQPQSDGIAKPVADGPREHESGRPDLDKKDTNVPVPASEGDAATKVSFDEMRLMLKLLG